MRSVLPWYQHHKIKLQINISHKLRHKNPQQNFSKSNPTMYIKIIYHNQIGFIPGHGMYNHDIFKYQSTQSTISEEKSFDHTKWCGKNIWQNSALIHDSASRKRRNFLSFTKSIYGNLELPLFLVLKDWMFSL